MEFICIECGYEFDEYEAEIITFGSGAVLSKTELWSCPICNSTELKDKKNNKIQNY